MVSTHDSLTTTLTARRADTKAILTIGDQPTEAIRALSDAGLLRCPECDGAVILKAGAVRLHHFAHLAACTNGHGEAETDSHRAGKWALYDHFRLKSTLAALEWRLGEQRADVYIEAAAEGTVGRFALEFQQANNSAAEWDTRHAGYRALGVTDCWFLGQVRYGERRGEALRPISPYDPIPTPREGFEAAAGAFALREMERAILTSQLAAGDLPRLVYLDPDDAMLTILLPRDLMAATLRAYRYRLPLTACHLTSGGLWTPLDNALEGYRIYAQKHRHF
ncbi:MAG TPA: competence protein CoiA family protein [Aggregatilineales bacterium]|nr:hypothetical protein [Anaerolineales bacterium]HRE49036.1 competence protein CoiA family protein [Aggregatilineales bacterium]